MKYKEFTSQLAVAMGGRVAEEITFGKDNITSGASSDIPAGDQDGEIHGDAARLFPTSSARWLMATTRRKCSWACRWAASRTCRRRPRQKIDAEVRRLVEEGYETARRILTEKKRILRFWRRRCSNTKR